MSATLKTYLWSQRREQVCLRCLLPWVWWCPRSQHISGSLTCCIMTKKGKSAWFNTKQTLWLHIYQHWNWHIFRTQLQIIYFFGFYSRVHGVSYKGGDRWGSGSRPLQQFPPRFPSIWRSSDVMARSKYSFSLFIYTSLFLKLKSRVYMYAYTGGQLPWFPHLH